MLLTISCQGQCLYFLSLHFLQKALQIIDDFAGHHWNLACLLPRSLLFYSTKGFVVGWIVAMVLAVVVMSRNMLRLLVKKETTKKKKKIMKVEIGGTRWCFTDERSKSMMVIS